MRSACCRPSRRLTRDQAMYHFISGYTAKLAGTEVGVKEPTATFSTCFGAPFMPRHPSVYAEMLGERMDRYDVPVWLVNTGWTGGPYGVGERMNITWTRQMVRAALNGRLNDVPTQDRSHLRLRGARALPGRPGRGALAARHLGRQGRLRRRGAQAGAACSSRTSSSSRTASSAPVRSAGPHPDATSR